MKKIKSELRHYYLQQRAKIDAEERLLLDQEICKKLSQLPLIHSAPIICSYRTDGTEPNLDQFHKNCLSHHQQLAFPRNLNQNPDQYQMALCSNLTENWITGRYNILEPDEKVYPQCSKEQLQQAIWIIPGVAFNSQCQRLGRGKGIYDQFIGYFNPFTIGVFYDCQYCDQIPEESHDKRVNIIITPKQIFHRNEEFSH